MKASETQIATIVYNHLLINTISLIGLHLFTRIDNKCETFKSELQVLFLIRTEHLTSIQAESAATVFFFCFILNVNSIHKTDSNLAG